jgi:hypothetical protein
MHPPGSPFVNGDELRRQSAPGSLMAVLIKKVSFLTVMQAMYILLTSARFKPRHSKTITVDVILRKGH